VRTFARGQAFFPQRIETTQRISVFKPWLRLRTFARGKLFFQRILVFTTLAKVKNLGKGQAFFPNGLKQPNGFQFLNPG
jgi:hypothetical protein